MLKKPTKYTDRPGVAISEQRVPAKLRPLLSFAKEWCFEGDTAVYRHLENTGEALIREFVSQCDARQASLERFCFDTTHPTPMPDEAVVFQIMYHNFMTARSFLLLKDSGETTGYGGR